MLLLNRSTGGYDVSESVITRCQWMKAQEFKLTETHDSEGDIVWSLAGPDVDLLTYSRAAVDEVLEDAGVDRRFIRFERCLLPGEIR